MFLQATRSQIQFLLRQKRAWFVFFLLLFLVLANYVDNVFTFRGTDLTEMIHPMKLLLLSYNKIYQKGDLTLLLIQIYPLLVSFPAGFSLAKERRSGLSVLFEARLGRRNYLFSKLIAVFCATAILFSVPFFLEIVLNCLAFPLNATGDCMLLSQYSPQYLAQIKNYSFYGIYWASPYLYAVIGTALFGILSGLLAAFTTAISACVRIKFSIVLFLPVFLLLYATIYLSNLASVSCTLSWYHYFFLFDEVEKNAFFYAVGISALILCSVWMISRSSRMDDLG